MLARVAAEFDDCGIRPIRLIGCGDTVVVEARYAGTGKATGLGAMPGYSATAVTAPT